MTITGGTTVDCDAALAARLPEESVTWGLEEAML